MNRRKFFKRTLGVIGGVVAAFAPKAKGSCIPPFDNLARQRVAEINNDISDTLKKIEKRIVTEFVCKLRCDCKGQSIDGSTGRIIVACPNHPPYYINEDGTKESVFYYPRAIDIKEQFS